MTDHTQKRRRRVHALTAAVFLAGASASIGRSAVPATPGVISDIDLAKPFATRSPWRFTAIQGPDIASPILGPSETEPGPIQLCLRSGPSAPCDAELRSRWPVVPPASDLYADLHYVLSARIVRPRGADGGPLLWVQATSLHSVDGGHLIYTQVLAYRPSQDRFARIYERRTGSNHNEDTRFVDAGPLRGDIISVEPTDNAPFGYWVSVSAYAPPGAYRQVLRYRSATRYNDGNALAVIDSEMPSIERRLGVWKAGAPLPLPSGPCPTPHLVRLELWCR